MATITFKDVEKTYDDGTTVIPNLNLEIKDKEFLILVGPSGCGKSTTLRMIAGLESVSKGELYIGDKVVNDIPPKDRDIAMVFQSYALYPHMTVYKNMAFGLTLRKVPKDEIDRKVKEAAEILNIEKYLHRKPKALSGGQRQRVALGRAMVRNPAVFLLDEPLSNLDAKLRTQMRTQIAELHQKLQTTFVYVTHDQVEAMTMADRIVVMKDGVINQVDTPQMLYNHPCNMFVAGFIGSPQMNFFVGTVTEKGIKIGETLMEYSKLEKLKAYESEKVIVGLRPEDIRVDIKDKNTISLEVSLAEMTGSEMYIYGEYAGKKIIAKTSSQYEVQSGDTITLGLNMDKAHIFNPGTEELICD